MNEIRKIINSKKPVRGYKFNDKWTSVNRIHGHLGGIVELTIPFKDFHIEKAISKTMNFLLKNNETKYEKLFMYARFQYIGLSVDRILTYVIDDEMYIDDQKITYTREMPVMKMNEVLLSKAIDEGVSYLNQFYTGDELKDEFLLQLCIFHTKNMINNNF
jgi:hypothetical protein